MTSSTPFSPWHYLGTGLVFAIIGPWFIWHATGNTQTPGLQEFNASPSCSASNLQAAASAVQGVCTVVSVPVVNKQTTTEFRTGGVGGSLKHYLITVGASQVGNPTYEIVNNPFFNDIVVGQPVYVMIFRGKIVNTLLAGQSIESVDNPDNNARGNGFRKILTALSLLFAAVAFFIVGKLLFFSPSDNS